MSNNGNTHNFWDIRFKSGLHHHLDLRHRIQLVSLCRVQPARVSRPEDTRVDGQQRTQLALGLLGRQISPCGGTKAIRIGQSASSRERVLEFKIASSHERLLECKITISRERL